MTTNYVKGVLHNRFLRPRGQNGVRYLHLGLCEDFFRRNLIEGFVEFRENRIVLFELMLLYRVRQLCDVWKILREKQLIIYIVGILRMFVTDYRN